MAQRGTPSHTVAALPARPRPRPNPPRSLLPQAVDTCDSQRHAIRIVVKYWTDNQLSMSLAYKMRVVLMLKEDGVLTGPTAFDLQRLSMGPMPKFDKQGRVLSRIDNKPEREPL